MSEVSSNPPRHAFEVRISIGGEDWDYVLRTLDDLAIHIREHGPGCMMCSGGAGGCHSVDITKRDVSRDQYREELRAWSEQSKQQRNELEAPVIVTLKEK